MIYSREFFGLQLGFAEKVCSVLGIGLERALLEYTNLYVRFGLGRDFDSENLKWREYLGGLREARDGLEWTYDFYRRDAEAATAPRVVATRGCFSYALTGPTRVRLHFRNCERGDCSPLSSARVEARRAELAELFGLIEGSLGDHGEVTGASWLYNLEAYRRLFPRAYVANPRVLLGKFRSMPLWGQLLDRRGRVKDAMTREFLVRLERARAIDDLDECFPLPVLTVNAPVRVFYDHYGI